jgi:hypothetical protein
MIQPEMRRKRKEKKRKKRKRKRLQPKKQTKRKRKRKNLFALHCLNLFWCPSALLWSNEKRKMKKRIFVFAQQPQLCSRYCCENCEYFCLRFSKVLFFLLLLISKVSLQELPSLQAQVPKTIQKGRYHWQLYFFVNFTTLIYKVSKFLFQLKNFGEAWKRKLAFLKAFI